MLTPASQSAVRLAVIGPGTRGAHLVKLLCETDPAVRLTALVDPRPGDIVRTEMQRRDVPGWDQADLFDDTDKLLRCSDRFDAILIATPCNVHTAIAIQVAPLRLPLLLEKPVAISWEQIETLRQAYAGREDSVVVSFPFRAAPHLKTAIEMIRAGRLGVINQVQAVNNVPYGGIYYAQWYRDYEKTGGLWLQKATHDFDYITQLIGARPIAITAMHSRLAYGGSMPPDLRCSACDRTETCPESPLNLTRRGDDGGTLDGATPTLECDHACMFSSSIQHQDAGSAIIMYDSGAHACYSQNFLTRRSAGWRGATVIGYDATLRLDWRANLVTVINHHAPHVEEIKLSVTGLHSGGDYGLARNFLDVIRGRDRSHTPLTDGLLSAAMCLCARQSAASGATQPIPSFASRSDAGPRPNCWSDRIPIEPPAPMERV